RLKQLLMHTRRRSQDEAAQRAKIGRDFAGIAVEFIEAARNSSPHVSFLPLYYAFLNLCKLVIACSPLSDEVAGGVKHGVSYEVNSNTGPSLFTEELKLQPRGVLPLLYKTLIGKELP